MTLEELKQIRERCEKATEGVWHWHGDRPYSDSPFGGDVHLDGFLGNSWAKADKDFIAHARTDIPNLLDEVNGLRADKEELIVLLTKAKTLATERQNELHKMDQKLAIATETLESWLKATPTSKDGFYCEKNQWHACRALEALAKIRGEK